MCAEAVAPVRISTDGRSRSRADLMYRQRVDPHELVTSIRTRQAESEVDAFNGLWFIAPHTWQMSRYCGVPILKHPCDLQIYHELITVVRPTLIIETGTGYGGSALWFAHQLDILGDGQVVSIDSFNRRDDGDDEWPRPEHDRVTWVIGDSLREETKRRVTAIVAGHDRILISLDADPHTGPVLEELMWYAPLTSHGSYCVVERTITSGRPVWMREGETGPGPAVDTFLAANPGRFVIDARCERYLTGLNPGGWLRRVG